MSADAGSLAQVGRMFRRNRVIAFAGGGLFLVLALGLLAPWIVPYDPVAQDLSSSMLTPSPSHWLGTDDQGRDLFSRLLYAVRIDFLVAIMAVTIGVVVGTPLGMLLGGSRRGVDRVGSIFVDAALAVPPLVFVLAVVAITGRGLLPAMVGFGLVFALPMLRVIRGEVLRVRREVFVRAAHVTGLSHRRVLWRHVFPEVIPAIIVQITVLFPAAFLVEASLSYLGLSVQPPQASLGSMLQSAQQVALSAPWQVIAPGLALLVIAVLFNLIADSLSEELTPRPSVAHLLRTARGPRFVPAPDTAARSDADPALVLEDVHISIDAPAGPRPVVRGVSLSVGRGEIVALIGESGSGKSLTAMTPLALHPAAARVVGGTVRVRGHEVVGATAERLRALRVHEVGLVQQDPLACLDPSHTVGEQVTAVLRLTQGLRGKAARTRAVELLTEVGITRPDSRLSQFAHELSGGIAQRVMIAMALARDSQLIVADEPTSALDATLQRQVLDLLRGLRDSKGIGILLVTHSMGVVSYAADRVCVMYAGEIVESGPTAEVLARPRHPYTQALLAAVPRNRPRTERLPVIPGEAPSLTAAPVGCAFAPRCSVAVASCTEGDVPVFRDGEHTWKCPHDERAWKFMRDKRDQIREASA
ncbi:dipeptide/oligopeptide/nickel ABC transporter permease/ATP-binding protein [Streptosporangium sp. NPDC004631]